MTLLYLIFFCNMLIKISNWRSLIKMTSIFLFFIIRSCDSYIICCFSELHCTNIVVLSRRLSATEKHIECDQEKCDWEKNNLEWREVRQMFKVVSESEFARNKELIFFNWCFWLLLHFQAKAFRHNLFIFLDKLEWKRAEYFFIIFSKIFFSFFFLTIVFSFSFSNFFFLSSFFNIV